VIGTSSGPSLLLVTKRSDAWDLRYEELTDYKEKHGDCNVPQSMGGLGEWVQRRRQDYKKGKLSKERTARLESIGYVWDLREHSWSEYFDQLTNYKAKNGDCNVPMSQGPLGVWANNHREMHKKGKLSDERIARLEGIGFIWDLHEHWWSERFDELTSYEAENGDCNVPQAHGPLGEWVHNRRQDYKNGRLSNERVASLESIGFVWDLEEHWWSERFGELTNYKDENGGCNVPTKQGPLGEWVVSQRQSFKKGKLPQGRVDLLESIGFSWYPTDEAWMARFDELVDFKNGNGNCNVPQSQGPLGAWVDKQRVNYKNGKLSQKRIELLESIGFEWVLRERNATKLPWKLDEQWKSRYTELVHYLIEHGDCIVPQKYGPLGRWVHRQRNDYKEGGMSQFRIDFLDIIGFVWTTKRFGREWHPEYSKPDPKAIARIISEEFTSSVSEGPKMRAKADKDLVEALQKYLDKS